MIERVFGPAAALALLLVCQASPVGGQTPEGPWQNVEFLGGVPAEDMDLFMGAMNVSLGVGCDYCHEAQAWHLDTLPAKTTARSMMRMIAALGEDAFEALELPSCWTCHRGSAAVSPGPSVFPRVEVPSGAFLPADGSADDVYESLELFGDLPARELAGVMETWSASLGVDCEYCHPGSDWSSEEDVNKLLARQMYRSGLELDRTYFGEGGRITCWTCHRGEAVPAIRLPGGAIP
jgi:hypothetical protein